MRIGLEAVIETALLAALAASACSGSDDEPARDAREVTARTSELVPSIDGNNGFAWSLYDLLRAESGNRFFSPFSIYAALSMTYAGARGITATQLHDVLQISGDDAQHHAAFGELIRDLSGEKQGRGYQLHIANRLFPRVGLSIDPTYLDLLATAYDAPPEQLDYAGDPEGARTRINEWVAEQTRDRIDELVPAGVLDATTALVLANAIYFKAQWAEQFDPADTREAPFTRSDGTQIMVPMMSAEIDARIAYDYSSDTEPMLLELDYQDHEVSMVVIVPPTYNGLDGVEQVLVSGGYETWLQTAHETEAVVELPKFEFRDGFSVVEPLQELGAPDMFCSGQADFSGIAPGLCVSQVLHQAYVKVDEEGTEAAAATAVVMNESAPQSFTVDRPFVFAIRDKLTGTILFLGRVEDPTLS